MILIFCGFLCLLVQHSIQNAKQVINSNLPVKPIVFVGRQKQVDDIVNVVGNRQTHIIVVTGGPGVGKSAMAVSLGYELMNYWRNVYYVSLDGATSYKDGIVRISVSLKLEGKKRNEVGLREWAQNLHKDTILLLDNSDYLILEPKNRIEFVQFLSNLVKECVGNSGQSLLYVILTSRFHLVIPDPPSYHVHLGILEQQDAIGYLRHFLPHMPHNKMIELAYVSGGVPLAILILGTLTKSLPVQDVDQIIMEAKLDPIDLYSQEEYAEKQLDRIISVSFRYLDSSVMFCFVAIAQFPGSFDEYAVRGIIANLTGDRKCAVKLVHRSLVEEMAPGRYYMHPFLQKYSLKLRKNITTEQRDQFKHLFVEHYMFLLLDGISSARVSSDTKRFYATLAREHHNVLYLIKKLSDSSVKVPLSRLLPFVMDTFDVIRFQFPENVVDWWDAIAKAGFATLRVSTCTSEHEQFVNFILSVTDTLVQMGEHRNPAVETLLLQLDHFLKEAQNCSKEVLVKFYRKMDAYYHLTGNDEKGFFYLTKFIKIMSLQELSGSMPNHLKSLAEVAVHFLRKGQYEVALLYLNRMQMLQYSFELAKAQVICLTHLLKFAEGDAIVKDAVKRFDEGGHESVLEKGKSCVYIAEMYHELANYEAEEKWLMHADTYLQVGNSGSNSMVSSEHVRWYLSISRIYIAKDEMPQAIQYNLKVLELLKRETNIPDRGMYLFKTQKILADLYLSSGEYSKAKLHYEEAMHVCAVFHENCHDVENIHLKIIRIDILQWEFGAATWKLGVLLKNSTLDLLHKISSWWTTTYESPSSAFGSLETNVMTAEVDTTTEALKTKSNLLSMVKLFSDTDTLNLGSRIVKAFRFELSQVSDVEELFFIWRFNLSMIKLFLTLILTRYFFNQILYFSKLYFTLEKFSTSHAIMPYGIAVALLVCILLIKIAFLFIVTLSWVVYIVVVYPPYKVLAQFGLCQSLYFYPKVHCISNNPFAFHIKVSSNPPPAIISVVKCVCEFLFLLCSLYFVHYSLFGPLL